VGHFERKFYIQGGPKKWYLSYIVYIVREVSLFWPTLYIDVDVARNSSMNSVATTLPLEVFTQRNFIAHFFSTEFEFYWQKKQNRVLCHTLGNLWVTYTVHLWLVGKSVVDFLLVLIELFSPDLTVETLWADTGRNCGVPEGGGSLWAQILGGKKAVVHQWLVASGN